MKRLFILFTLLFVVFSVEECLFEQVPSSFIFENNEYNLNGYFLEDFNQDRTIDFEVQQKSLFRIYVGPNKVDIDIYLRHEGQTIAFSQSTFKSEEVIHAWLQPGQYSLLFRYYRRILVEECETILLDVQITSSYRMMKCPSTSSIPDIEIPTLQNGSSFKSSVNGLLVNWNDQDWIHHYEINLPRIENQLWRIQSYLEAEFIYGDVQLLVKRKESKMELDCADRSQCTTSINSMKDVQVLDRYLPAGDYHLWLVASSTMAGFNCLNFQLELQLTLEEPIISHNSTYIANIYGGGPYIQDEPNSLSDLRNSGFTTVTAWAIHIDTNGDIFFNNDIVIHDDQIMANMTAFINFFAKVNGGNSTVKDMVLSIGGWGDDDFESIQGLIQQQGTGKNTTLYKHFSLIKKHIPAVTTIDYDDETLYDYNTTVTFSLMLQEIGFKVSFCPYSDSDYWTSMLPALINETSSLVTRFNLQCYAGGSGNDPSDWIFAIQGAVGKLTDASTMVVPGLWVVNSGCATGSCPSDITSQFQQWRSTGIVGGFLWLYDDIMGCVGTTGYCNSTLTSRDYANSIFEGLVP
eukprot:TRINITY_DN1893_c0_g1_i1.p1 TRINITY_DN1893_c0_g1~~TRINITY_DN1893_c0_g1_i1.p1  ORF type:complete len:575 (+),score=154.51 TRINITY_DN1893_c0_g1_i1:40-1764(+)